MKKIRLGLRIIGGIAVLAYLLIMVLNLPNSGSILQILAVIGATSFALIVIGELIIYLKNHYYTSG